MQLREVNFSKLTILVVDDQDYIRSLIVQLLKRLGVGQVIEEPDGASALTRLRDTIPDLVLCDLKMDPVDGMEFLREVRAGHAGLTAPLLPIIFLTADNERDTVLHAIENDVDGYLVKPVGLDDLKAKISAALTRRTGPVTWK